jgi:membrane protease YdiL (CAAX protease family)
MLSLYAASMFADRPDLLTEQSVRSPQRIWSLRDLLIGVAVLPVGFVAIAVVLRLLHLGRTTEVLMGSVAFEVLMAAVVLGMARWRGISLARLGFVRPNTWWAVVRPWLGAYGVMMGYGLVLELMSLLHLDVSRFEGGNPLPVERGAGIVALAMLGVTVTCLAPLCEELFFRAFVFLAIRGRTGLLAAAVLSGLAFALFHVNLSVLIPFALIGVLLAWAMEASGSLWTSIVAHALVNLLAFVVSVATLGR